MRRQLGHGFWGWKLRNKQDDQVASRERCLVQCPHCGLIYQVEGLPGPDQWCVRPENLNSVRCPNCGGVPIKFQGRLARRRHRRGRPVTGSGRESGCVGLESVKGPALRRRAIIALMTLRITGQPCAIPPYYMQMLEAELTDSEIDWLCTALGHPRFCPGGNPIPKGRCCVENRVAKRPVVLPVSSLDTGAKGKVLVIRDLDDKRLEYLEHIGVIPGVQVSVVSASPNLIVGIDYTSFAMDPKLAMDIYLLVDYS